MLLIRSFGFGHSASDLRGEGRELTFAWCSPRPCPLLMNNKRTGWKGSWITVQTPNTQRQVLLPLQQFLGLLIMKVLVVSLALTIFAGSQAFVLRDESPSKLSQLQKKVEQDMRNLWNAMSKKGEIVEESEIARVLRTWTEDRQTQLGQRMEALRNAFPPEIEEISKHISLILRDGMTIPYMALGELYRNLSDEIRALHQALEHDLDPILEKVERYTHLLHHDLVKVGMGLSEKLDEMLKWSVERLQPLAKEMPSKLQEVQGSLDPIVDRAQKVTVTEVENVRDTLQQIASRILDFLNKYGEDLHQ